MSVERLGLRITQRAIEELGQIYTDPRDVVRELIQNAIDAGATRVSIDVVEEGGRRWLVVEHDGAPIEGECLDAFLTIGTDYKARRGGMLGYFGIGRLAWISIGDLAIIESGSRVFVWRRENLMEIEARERGEYLRGVRWRIRIVPEKEPDIDVERIRWYVSDNYAGAVPVYVSGKRVPSVLEGAERIAEGPGFVAYLISSRAGCIIKNWFVVKRPWYLTRLALVATSDEVRLSSSRYIIEDHAFVEWRRRAIKAAMGALMRRGAEWVAREIGVKDWFEMARYGAGLLGEDLAAHLVLRELTPRGERYVFGYEVMGSRVAYVDVEVSDSVLRRLWSSGYRVIAAIDDFHWSSVAEAMKAVPAEAAVESLRASGASVGRRVADAVEEALSVVEDAIKKVAGEAAPRPGSGRVLVVESGPSGIVSRPSAGVPIIRDLIVSSSGRRVVFVEADDENVLAFTDGERIYVNVRSPEVRELVALTKRLRKREKIVLLWAPIILHEVLHWVGLDHGTSAWSAVYERAIARIIVDCVKKL